MQQLHPTFSLLVEVYFACVYEHAGARIWPSVIFIHYQILLDLCFIPIETVILMVYFEYVLKLLYLAVNSELPAF